MANIGRAFRELGAGVAEGIRGQAQYDERQRADALAEAWRQKHYDLQAGQIEYKRKRDTVMDARYEEEQRIAAGVRAEDRRRHEQARADRLAREEEERRLAAAEMYREMFKERREREDKAAQQAREENWVANNDIYGRLEDKFFPRAPDKIDPKSYQLIRGQRNFNDPAGQIKMAAAQSMNDTINKHGANELTPDDVGKLLAQVNRDIPGMATEGMLREIFDAVASVRPIRMTASIDSESMKAGIRRHLGRAYINWERGKPAKEGHIPTGGQFRTPEDLIAAADRQEPATPEIAAGATGRGGIIGAAEQARATAPTEARTNARTPFRVSAAQQAGIEAGADIGVPRGTGGAPSGVGQAVRDAGRAAYEWGGVLGGPSAKDLVGHATSGEVGKGFYEYGGVLGAPSTKDIVEGAGAVATLARSIGGELGGRAAQAAERVRQTGTPTEEDVAAVEELVSRAGDTAGDLTRRAAQALYEWRGVLGLPSARDMVEGAGRVVRGPEQGIVQEHREGHAGTGRPFREKAADEEMSQRAVQDPELFARLKERSDRMFGPGLTVKQIQPEYGSATGTAAAYVNPMGEGFYKRAATMYLPTHRGDKKALHSLAHEGLHYLQSMRAIDDDDYHGSLTRAAMEKWIDEFDIEERYGARNTEEAIAEALGTRMVQRVQAAADLEGAWTPREEDRATQLLDKEIDYWADKKQGEINRRIDSKTNWRTLWGLLLDTTEIDPLIYKGRNPATILDDILDGKLRIDDGVPQEYKEPMRRLHDLLLSAPPNDLKHTDFVLALLAYKKMTRRMLSTGPVRGEMGKWVEKQVDRVKPGSKAHASFMYDYIDAFGNEIVDKDGPHHDMLLKWDAWRKGQQ